ncbi:MAG: hypothetical protein RQ801_12930 [Spirochaetaceae bacterium]|nr:hypothetical protein [Spirochaetaceae bacterium]MDT8299204.1 hypothetical protein [Spirochaetaceae bacterium]
MDEYRLLIDLHKQGRRQGPGGDTETEQAFNLAAVDRKSPLKAADIGCGTGASTRKPFLSVIEPAVRIAIKAVIRDNPIRLFT